MDNESQATFKEVLQIEADLKAFEASLAQIKSAYQSFMADLGNQAEGVLGVGMFSSFKQELAGFANEFRALTGLTAQVLEEIAGNRDEIEEKAEQRSRERAKETNRQKLADEQKLREAIAELGTSDNIAKMTPQQREAHHIADEQEGTVVAYEASIEKLAAKQKKLDQEISIERQGLLDQYSAKLESIAEKQKKLAEEIAVEQQGLRDRYTAEEEAKAEARAAHNKKLAEEIEIERQRLLDEYAAKQEAIAERQRKLAIDIVIEQQGLRDQFAAKQEQLAQRQLNLAREIKAEQQGIEDSHTADLERNAAKLNAELERTEALLRKSNFSAFGKDLKGQMEALKARLSEVNDEIRLLQAATSKPIGGMATEEQLAVQKGLNRALQEQVELQNKINSVQNQMDRGGKGFFDRMQSGWANTAAHMVKVMVVWQGLMLVMDAAREIFAAPFKAIAEGVKYTQQMERSADELMGVLSNSVKYSDNLSENYNELRKNAEAAVQKLQDIAVYTHAPLESVERTFKSLIDNGITKYTSSMDDVLQMTTMFTAALRVAGVGGLQLNQEIATIPKLMDGTVQATNRFLRVLGLTPLQWEAMLQKSKANHDLISQLAPRMEPFLNALEKGKLHQAVLLEQFDLLRKRVEAVAAAPLYDKITEAIQYLNEWLQTGAGEVVAVLKNISLGIYGIAQSLISLASSFGIFDLLKTQMFGLLVLLHTIRDVIVTTKNFIADTMSDATVTSLEKRVQDLTGDRSRKGMAEGEQLDTNVKPGDNEYVQAAKKALHDAYLKRIAVIQQTINDELDNQAQHEALDDLRTGAGAEKMQAKINEILNALKKPFTDISQNHPKAMDLQPFIAEIQEAYQLYQDADERIKEGSDSSRKKVEQDLAANVISHKEAADQIRQISINEMNARNEAWNEYVAAYQQARKEIENTPASDESERKKKTAKLSTLDLGMDRQRRQVQKEQQQADDQYQNSLRAALTEEQAIRKAHVAFLLDLRKDQGKQELAILKQQHEAGYLTDLEFFARETETLKKEHDTEVAIIRERMSDFEKTAAGTSTKEYKALVDKLSAEDLRWLNLQEQRTGQRISLVEKERNAREAYADKLRELNIEAGQMALDIQQTFDKQTVYTAQMEQMYLLRDRELKQLQAEKQAQLEVAQAKNFDSEQTRKLAVEVQSLANQRLALFSEQARQISGTTPNPALARIYQRNLAQGELNRLRADQDAAGKRLQDASDRGAPIEVQRKLAEEYNLTRQRVEAFRHAMERLEPSFKNAGRSFLQTFTGVDIKNAWENAHGAAQKAAVVANTVAGGLAGLKNVLAAWKQGKEQGGTLGGISGVMDQFMPALSAIPVVGQFMPAISGVLGFVGGLFTAAAKKIAEDAKKKFQETIDALNDGNATLQQTLDALQRQRMDTIRRLSGTKGGQEELDKLLKEFDDQIKQLRKQQHEIIQAFDESLHGLELHSDALSQIQQQWSQILKTVREYLGAGGDATAAAKYLSIQLENVQKDAQRELNDANQQAIQDAISLNDLLQQRIEMNKTFEKQKFDLLNADSIERRQAGAVTRGQQVKELEAQHQKELDALDAQINLTSKKVEMEGKVFDLSGDIATLHRRDEELTLKALDDQIGKWQDLKSIIDSIQMSPDGIFSSSNPLLSKNTTITVNFYGDIIPGGDGSLEPVYDTVKGAVEDGLRSGSGDY